MANPKITKLLGDQSDYLLNHVSKTIDKSLIHATGPDVIDRLWIDTDRNIPVLNNLQRLFGHGRLANTGYLSILPVDQGIEHTAGASFAPNPLYFDPENIVKLALEADCNAVASTFGVLASVARKYAHKIPFVVKMNHNELLTYPNSYNQIPFGTVKEAWNLGAAAVGATIYFGSEESRRQIVEVAEAFEYAHELGMATILWCYLRNNAFKKDGTVTAFNASSLNDGAAALILMSADKAKKLGLKPLARVVASASAAVEPRIMGMGPVPATLKALKYAGMTLNDIDYWELNEAFAAQALACMQELNIPVERCNAVGSGISLGHPVGMTGASIILAAINELKRRGGRFACSTMCASGGPACAFIIENIN